MGGSRAILGDCFFCLQKPIVFRAKSPLCTQLLTELEHLLASTVGLPQGGKCVCVGVLLHPGGS